MKAKKVFLIINFVITLLVALTCLAYVVANFVVFDWICARATDVVMWFANRVMTLDVLREDIVSGVEVAMLAIAFVTLGIFGLKVMFAVMQIKYFNMNYTEFYTHRVKYLLLIVAHTFTGSFFLEWLIMIVALLCKTREEKELEKDLRTGSIGDVKSAVFDGTGISGDSGNNLLYNAGPATMGSTNYYQQKTDEKARNNAMDLWRSGAISERQYQKIIKKLERKKK